MIDRGIINSLISKTFGYRLIKSENHDLFVENLNHINFIKLLYKFDPKFLTLLHNSESQILQDIMVLLKTNYKKQGFFVELVAKALHLSMTFLASLASVGKVVAFP